MAGDDDVQQARLFVAVVPPPEVLDVIAGLDRPDEPGVRYTTRDQWHVTVRFLGTAPVRAAVDALARVRAAPARAELGPSVARLGRGTVVIPVAGLDALNAAVTSATAQVGTPPDPRPFTGHLTVARLRRRGACRIAGERVQVGFAVDRIHLVRSHLRPTGAEHEVIATQRLGPADGPEG